MYEYTIFWVAIHQLMYFWVVSTFWLIWTAMLSTARNTHVQVFLWIPLFNYFGYIRKNEIFVSYRNSRFNCLRSCQLFSTAAETFYTPTATYKGSDFSISSQKLVTLFSGSFSNVTSRTQHNTSGVVGTTSMFLAHKTQWTQIRSYRFQIIFWHFYNIKI